MAEIGIFDPKDYTPKQIREIVAQLIEQNHNRLDMGDYISMGLVEKIEFNPEGPIDPGCGTVGCIVGFTLFAFDRELYLEGTLNDLDAEAAQKRAADLLGMRFDDAHDLFHGDASVWDRYMSLSEITPEMVADKLRSL